MTKARVGAVILAWCLAASVGAAPSRDGSAAAFPAWQKAREAGARGASLSPSRIEYRVEELDASGKVLSWEEGESLVTYENSPPKTTVVRAVKDGKDVSSERRGRGSGGSGGGPAGFDATPFDPRFAFVPGAARPRAEGGRALVEVPYALDDGKVAVSGVAVFDELGRPVSASQGYDRHPPLLSDMRAEFSYAYSGDALVCSAMAFSGRANLIVAKKHFRMTMRFSDYVVNPHAAGGNPGS